MSTTRESKIARSFAALASGDALARAVAFVAGVFVARRLGAEMFGVMAFGQAVVLYFTHLAACGVDLTGIRDIAQAPERARTHAPSILTFRTLVSAGLIALLIGGALLVLPLLDAAVLALYALTLFGHGPNPKFVLMGLSRPAPVAWARTAGEVLYVALVLAFVERRHDIVYVPWAQALGDILAVLLMTLALRRAGFRLDLELDWPAVRPLFARSFPLVLNILLGLLIFNSDLIVLRFFRDTETVGWYSASYQLISFLINMAWAYSYSLLPSLAQARADTGERQALYQTSLAQSFAVGLPIAVGGGVLSSALIALVFGRDYAQSGPPLAILIASIPWMLHKDVAMVAMIVAGRERAVAAMTAIAVVFNLLANVLVIPRYGMIGAASTTLATEVLRCVLAAWFVRRDGFAWIDPRRLWKSAVAAAAMAAVLVPLLDHPVWLAIPSGAAVYALTLLAMRAVEWRRGAWPVLRV
ncbi:MAG: flippase [Planctomycetes bacterium]|nr:flippase [Planctomycetota bacterium]